MKDTRLFKIVLVISFLFSMKIVLGQEKRSLTEADAIRMGLETSKQLHTSQMKIDAAEARESEVSAGRLPSLKLTAGYTRQSEVPAFALPANAFGPGAPPEPLKFSSPVQNLYQLKLTGQEQLFSGMRIEETVKAARYSHDASQLEYTKDKIEITFNVRNAYWNLFKAKENKKVVDENLEQIKAHLKDAQNLYAQGMITNNDVLKIQVQLSNVQLIQIDAQNGVEVAQVNLNNLIGLPLTTEIEIASEIKTTDRGFGSSDELIRKGWDNRQDLKAMNLRVMAAEAGVSAAKGAYYPQVSLQGNYFYNRPNARYFPAKDEFKTSWDLGLNITFDAWNWGATGNQVRQAQSQVEQTKDALGLMKDGASLEITQTYLAMKQARQKIGVAKQTVEQSEESYRITSEKYKKGVALTTDLLDAEVALLGAKTTLTNAMVDFELAQARLLKATGDN